MGERINERRMRRIGCVHVVDGLSCPLSAI